MIDEFGVLNHIIIMENECGSLHEFGRVKMFSMNEIMRNLIKKMERGEILTMWSGLCSKLSVGLN